MTRAEKTAVIEQLKDKFSNTKYFYLTDASTLTVEDINAFRRECFEKDVEVVMYKNTLIRKALEQISDNGEYDALYDSLKGQTTVMFTETGNLPAKILKEFRKTHEKPVLKAAFIESSVYVGDNEIDSLTKLKSKEELIGEIIGLLQSPVQNVLGALSSGGTTIAGILKTLEEREEA